MSLDNKPTIIAFYLPQFHPTVENDSWWGTGFTEWTNVGKAQKLFPGHYQPKVPADLGYYDLRISDIRYKQALLAKEAGVDGFCYWHYWFEGRKLLEKPYDEMLRDHNFNFPFCVCWANHSWYSKTWNKDIPDKLLIEQTYGGISDYTSHFYDMLDAFRDERYIKIEGKPVFGIYDYRKFSDIKTFVTCWNQLARDNGFEGIHFFSIAYKKEQINNILAMGCDAVVYDLSFLMKSKIRIASAALNKLFHIPQLIFYKDYIDVFLREILIRKDVYPCVIPNFDHTPRSGRRGALMVGSTPKRWGDFMRSLFRKIETSAEKSKVIFIKSWNEWGEGNYMEPDWKYGKGYITELRSAIDELYKRR